MKYKRWQHVMFYHYGKLCIGELFVECNEADSWWVVKGGELVCVRVSDFVVNSSFKFK